MKKRALRRENLELDAALAETLELHWRENKANTALRDELRRERSVIAALCNGSQRLRKERDAALADVAELLRDEEASTSCIRDLRRSVAELQEERDNLRLELAGMTSDAALDAAMADVETLTQANLESDHTIGKLRDDLADARERLDAALTEAARMRKEWAGDVSAAREIVERKSNEIADLRRTISDLRGDLAKVRGDLERVTESWQHAEDLLQERERELDALRDQQAQQEHAEPVVTLQAIKELEDGERLIDDNGVIIESVPGGYEVRGAIFQAFKATPVDALHYYHEITGK